MTSLETILHHDSWVPYNDSFFHSRLVLAYPKNKIFTVQLLTRVTSSDVYKKYPSAELFDLNLLKDVDWDQGVIVLDHDLRVVMAPDPVLKLIQLDRRLHYAEAARSIFGPFRISPVELFRSQWIWLAVIIIGWCVTTFWLDAIRRRPYRLVVQSKM